MCKIESKATTANVEVPLDNVAILQRLRVLPRPETDLEVTNRLFIQLDTVRQLEVLAHGHFPEEAA